MSNHIISRQTYQQPPIHEAHSGLSTTLIPDSQVQQRKQMASTHYRQGNSAYLADNYTLAVECYTCALEQWCDDAATWNNRGMSYVALSLIRTGIRDYQQAIQLSPGTSEFYYKRGIAYGLLRDFPKCIQDYTTCLNINPTHADALNNRGNAFTYLGDLNQAFIDLKHACELHPNNTMYYNNFMKIQTTIQQTSVSIPIPPFTVPTPRSHTSSATPHPHGFQSVPTPTPLLLVLPQHASHHDIHPQQPSMMVAPMAGLLMNQEIPGWKRVDVDVDVDTQAQAQAQALISPTATFHSSIYGQRMDQ